MDERGVEAEAEAGGAEDVGSLEVKGRGQRKGRLHLKALQSLVSGN